MASEPNHERRVYVGWSVAAKILAAVGGFLAGAAALLSAIAVLLNGGRR